MNRNLMDEMFEHGVWARPAESERVKLREPNPDDLVVAGGALHERSVVEYWQGFEEKIRQRNGWELELKRVRAERYQFESEQRRLEAELAELREQMRPKLTALVERERVAK